MEIYCLKEFKSHFEKLKKNNSYQRIEKEIIENFFGKKPSDFFKMGAKITGTPDIPFIKKRISGSGGWRFYYLLIIKGGKIYLMYLHPKTGTMGFENIGVNFEKQLYEEVLASIKSNDLYKVSVIEGVLVFKHNLIEKEDLKIMNKLVHPIEIEGFQNIEKNDSNTNGEIK